MRIQRATFETNFQGMIIRHKMIEARTYVETKTSDESANLELILNGKNSVMRKTDNRTLQLL